MSPELKRYHRIMKDPTQRARLALMRRTRRRLIVRLKRKGKIR